MYYYRGKEDSSWKEIYRLPSYGYDEELQFVGISKQDENIVYAIAFNGEDRSALWAFDTNKGAFIEKVYQRPDVDILAVVDSHNVWEKSDSDDDKTGPDIVGVVYGTDRYHIDWFDAEEKALHEGLEAAIPNGYEINITSASRDDSVMVVSNQGPHDPGSFYLFKDGQLSYLGGTKPHIKPEDLDHATRLFLARASGMVICVSRCRDGCFRLWPLGWLVLALASEIAVSGSQGWGACKWY